VAPSWAWSAVASAVAPSNASATDLNPDIEWDRLEMPDRRDREKRRAASHSSWSRT
jgi:hypothetical protein